MATIAARRHREAQKAARDVRDYLARALVLDAEGLRQEAYRAAESAEAACFDFRSIIGGSITLYYPESNKPIDDRQFQS